MAVEASGDHCASFLLGTCGVFERFSALGAAMLCNLFIKGFHPRPLPTQGLYPAITCLRFQEEGFAAQHAPNETIMCPRKAESET